MVKVAESNLALEKEVSKLEIASLKQAVKSLEQKASNFEKEKADLVDQLESIGLEAMSRERYTLMKQFLSGDYKEWTPEDWIKDYEDLVKETSEQIGEEQEKFEDAENVVEKGGPSGVERNVDMESGKFSEAVDGFVAP